MYMNIRHQYYLSNLIKNKIKNEFKNIYILGGGNYKVGDALSTQDVYKYLGGKTKILTYPLLTKYNNLDDLLDPYNNIVILYLTREKFGHYCALVKRKGKICFFDSYGGNKKPDEQLEFINDHFRLKSNQDFPHLTKLLYESKYPVEYNEHQYQEKGPHIATCGYHCVNFIKSGLDIDQYYKKMKQLKKKYNKSFDELVVDLI